MSCGNPFKHAIEDVKETFSKYGELIQGNDWCALVPDYETEFDLVDYENECLQFGIGSMEY